MVEITLLAQCLRRKCTMRATSPILRDALAIRQRVFWDKNSYFRHDGRCLNWELILSNWVDGGMEEELG